MTILNNGNVGIGTTSPSQKLHVEGSGFISSSLNVGTGLSISNGKLTINETTGTFASATTGTIVLDHQNSSGGGNSIVFKSKANAGAGADYGYIEYRDNYNTGNTENSALILGVENDVSNPINVDSIYLKTANNDRLKVNGSGIYAYVPIYRSVYNTGEHIKTTLYSNENGSGALTVNTQSSKFWPESLNGFAFTRTFTDSSIIINIDANYQIPGHGDEYYIVEVYIGTSVTDSSPTFIYRTYQSFTGSGGGGTRSRTLFPLSCSYKTTNATLNLAVRVKVFNLSATDVINLCQSSLDYWTVTIQEYR
jgi:hypothetical protein